MLKAMGAGPTGRVTYAAGGRLDGIGRRAIGDMVSSAVASSSTFRRLPEKQPAQALSRDIGASANRVDYTFAALDAALLGAEVVGFSDKTQSTAPRPARVETGTRHRLSS